MKTRMSTILAIISSVSLTVMGCGSGDDSTPAMDDQAQYESSSKSNSGYQTANPAVTLTFYDARDRYDELDRRLESLQNQIERQGAVLDEDTADALDALELQMTQLEMQLEQMEHSTSNVWDDVKEDVAENLDELEQELDRTWRSVTGSMGQG